MKGWLAAAGGAIVTIGGVLAVWGTWGWITRGEYAADHLGADSVQQILQAVEETKQASARYHRHWECDEAFEEIVELRELGEAGGLDVADAFRLEQLVRKFEKLGCEAFDTD